MPVPPFEADGTLPPGIHSALWVEVANHLGSTARRRSLLRGLSSAITQLRFAGCRRIWLDGSFVTTKPEPGDYDACWDPGGVDVKRLDPVFLDLTNGRRNQKIKYLGEWFPFNIVETASGKVFLDFFQQHPSGGPRASKGIVTLDLTVGTP
jgi:hypothetical protein